MKPLTVEMAEFAQSVSYESVPQDAINKVLQVVFDLLGIKGFVEKETSWGLILSGFTHKYGTNPGANALVNGSLFLGYELEDTLTESYLHVGPSALATAIAISSIKKVTGKQLITALFCGYQLIGKLGEEFGKNMLLAGPHPTAHLTHISSAAIASKLLKLSKEQTAYAIGIAAATSSGLVQSLDEGSMTRRLYGGLPAQNGIMAALLAQQGFDGPLESIEGKHGLIKGLGISNDVPVEQIIESFTGTSYLSKVSLKQYACCHAFHAVIDGVLTLQKEHSILVDSIESISAGIKCISTSHANPHPKTVVSAQYSLPYCISAALIHGALSHVEFTENALQDKNISSLSEKVITLFPEKLQLLEGFPGEVKITLKDRRVLKKFISHPKGHSSNPLNKDEIINKHTSLVSQHVDGDAVMMLWNNIQSLPQIDDISLVIGL